MLLRLSFPLRSLFIGVLCGGSISAAYASHALGADLTYTYAGTASHLNQYHVKARLFRDAASLVDDSQITLTCGMNE